MKKLFLFYFILLSLFFNNVSAQSTIYKPWTQWYKVMGIGNGEVLFGGIPLAQVCSLFPSGLFNAGK